MRTIRRRTVLAGTAGLLAAPAAMSGPARADVKPRVTFISQWAAGSDGAAITALGRLVEEHGGTWQHSPVPGFTTEMMNKLRAQILAGDPPAASQLKGPEIAAWSQIAPTRDVSDLVAASGYEAVVPADLAKLHKPAGKWIALPLQIYRINTLFASRRAMDKVGATALPKTWAEFNDLASRMKAAGIASPVANGGIRWDDGMKFEIALAGISPATYRKAIMELDPDALRSKEVLAAFVQLRKLASWMDPNIAAQSYSVLTPRFIGGDMGLLLMGGWAQGVMLNLGNKLEDFIIGPAPQDGGKPTFILNADAFIFWQRKEPDLQAGQTLLANLTMVPATQAMYSQITGSIPVRTDMDLSGPGWSNGQRDAAAGLRAATASGGTLLSLAHNMAQPNQVTAAMIDVLTEYVHNASVTPQQGMDQLSDAVDSAR